VETILVIEDEADVQKVVKREFESAGYTVQLANDGTSGLESFKTNSPSAIVLDLCLPGMLGKEVCQRVRKESPTVPIVVLSALADVSDKVLLLEIGADDYVTKPFSPRELRARVEAAWSRQARLAALDTFTFGNIVVDFKSMDVARENQPVSLTPQEFKLLRFFVRNQQRVVSREEILNQVWGYENYPSTRTVDNHILRLRQKLEQNAVDPVHFLTVHGIGYKFVP
jgi:DNA-binding response OmpR family regulator